MHVRRILLRNFMSHDITDLRLPERGVVVVQGDNGSGKSTLVEAVAVAGWGKSLRGTPPWRKGTAGSVEVYADELVMARSASAAGKVGLSWREGEEVAEGAKFETTTKAQDALARIVGPLDVWRRASVHSSSDAALFTLSTDGERKRLLEELLGVGKFDSALEACRIDLRAVGKRADQAQRDREMADERLTAERRRAGDAREALAAMGEAPVAPSEGEPRTAAGKTVADLYERRSEVEKAVDVLRGRLRALDRAGGEHAAHAQGRRALAATLARDACPTCEQAIPEALRGRLATEAEQAEERALDEARAAGEARGGIEQEIADLEEEGRLLGDQRAGLATQAKADERARAMAASWTRQRSHHEGVLASSDAAVAALETAVARARAEETTADQELGVLVAVEKVLGLKGVRSTVLGSALSGIESVANAWLARLRNKSLSIKLAPYAEKKGGGTTDAISLTVDGAGEGYGYRATSNGERRRIDVALLFALAEVAGAARGRATGTMFFDEVFDALDSDGIDALGDALRDLARDRAVVVITHNSALASRLDAVARLRVVEGRLS